MFRSPKTDGSSDTDGGREVGLVTSTGGRRRPAYVQF